MVLASETKVELGDVDHVRIMKILVLLGAMFLTVSCQRPWERPGCHLLGHTRDIKIPGCVEFRLRTNACRGYCTSYSIPSSSTTLLVNPNHIITTRGECCSMVDTHDVKVRVNCWNEQREFTFKSAASCACSVCRHR